MKGANWPGPVNAIQPVPRPDNTPPPAQVAILRGHHGDVSTAAFAPNGRTLLTGDDEGVLKVWDVASHSLIATHVLAAIQFGPQLGFSADGTRLACNMPAGIMLRNGVTRRLLPGMTFKGRFFDFSPDGQKLLCAEESILRLCDVATGKEEAAWNHLEAKLGGVCFAPDGRTFAASLYTTNLPAQGVVALCETATGHELARFDAQGSYNGRAAFAPDGKTLATAGRDQTVILYDVATGNRQAVLKGHTGCVSCVAFSPDGKILVSIDGTSTVRLWDVATALLLATLQARLERGSIGSMAFSPDGKLLATGGVPVVLWDVATVTKRQPGPPVVKHRVAPPHQLDLVPAPQIAVPEIAKLAGLYLGEHCLAYSPDGKTFAMGDSRVVKLIDAASGKLKHTLPSHADRVTSVAFSPDGKYLASSGRDTLVRLRDAATGRLVATFVAGGPALAGPVHCVVFSPDSTVLAVGEEGGAVRLYDVAGRMEAGVLKPNPGQVYSLAFATDSKILAAAMSDGSIVLWNLTARKQKAILKGHVGRAFAVRFFDRDRKLVSAGTDDRLIKLWDVRTHKELSILESGADRIYAMAVAPDGRTLATGTVSSTVTLWDLAAEKESAKFRAGQDGFAVFSLAFSPDSQRLAMGGRHITLWDVSGIVRGVKTAPVRNQPPASGAGTQPGRN